MHDADRIARGNWVSCTAPLQSLTVAHTRRYHRHHRSSGHVWQGRFKSPVIQDDMHLLVVLRYMADLPIADIAEVMGCAP